MIWKKGGEGEGRGSVCSQSCLGLPRQEIISKGLNKARGTVSVVKILVSVNKLK